MSWTGGLHHNGKSSLQNTSKKVMLCGKVSLVLAMDTDTERNVRQNSKSVISSDMPMTVRHEGVSK